MVDFWLSENKAGPSRRQGDGEGSHGGLPLREEEL
jgi:hypothetical protein